MRAIELFAGVGGFRIGLERAGHKVIWANEWDRYACDTYDKNFRDGGHLIDRRDLTTIPATDIPAHDLIVGGFPCQAFSIAGKRRGFEETRGTLFFEIMRIAQHHRTPYLFLENVKGLLNHDKGRTFEVILRTLDELGYDCQWQVLNSKNFGVPQNRERVIIIGHLRTEPRPEVFPLGDYDGEVTELPGQHSNTLTTRYEGGQATGTYVIESELNAQIDQLNSPKHSNDRVYGVGGISPTLNTIQGGNRQPFVAPAQWRRTEKGKEFRREAQKNGEDKTPFNNGYRELVPKDSEVVGTITAHAVAKDSLLFSDMRIRRLTPTECERLQGFPDGWTEGVSDSQRYKQMGNAVTTNVIEAVARRLPLVR